VSIRKFSRIGDFSAREIGTYPVPLLQRLMALTIIALLGQDFLRLPGSHVADATTTSHIRSESHDQFISIMVK
jgi:hypothetical protein